METKNVHGQGPVESASVPDRYGMTRRHFMGSAAVLGAVLGTGLLSGCGQSSSSGDSDASPKVLSFAQKNAKMGLDEHYTNDQLSYSLGDLVAEAPCRWTEDLEEVPCLLTEMPTVSDDGLTYSLELKQGITCHDGSTLTASDVKYSAERMMWPATKYKSMYMINMIEGSSDVIAGTTTECSGITVVDDLHLTIKLAYVYPAFLSILGSNFFVVYPRAAVEAAGDSWGTGTNFVGTGPFKVTSNDDATKLVFEKFAGYHGDAAKIDELDVSYIDDSNTKMMSYANGDIDIADVDPTLLTQYQNDATVKDELHEYDPIGTYFLNLNLSVAKLQDVRVRQAISLAINRQELVDTILSGAGTPASEYLNPVLPGHDDSLATMEYDPDKARQLLVDAGVTDLSIDCGVRSTESSVAVAVQSYLSQVGITLNVSTLDSGLWSDYWREGQLETTILSWNLLFKDAGLALYTLFYSDAAKQKGSFYDSPEFDELVDEGRAELDETRAAELFRQADHILCLEDYATCPLYYPKRYFAAKPYVSGMKVGDLVFHFRDVDVDMSEKSS